MGQREIIELFKGLEEMGEVGFISLNQINKKTRCNFDNTKRAVYKLCKAGILERNTKNKWQKFYRLKHNL